MFAQAENFHPQNLCNVLWFWYGVHMYGPVGIRRGCPGTRIWNETSQLDCPQTFMVCALGSGNVCDEAFARPMTLLCIVHFKTNRQTNCQKAVAIFSLDSF